MTDPCLTLPCSCMFDFVAPCVEPAAPAHGRIDGQDFRHGQSVKFWCFYGYTRVGASSITCNDGNWDQQFPVCKG